MVSRDLRQLFKKPRSFLENVACLFVVLGCGLNSLVHVRTMEPLSANHKADLAKEGRV